MTAQIADLHRSVLLERCVELLAPALSAPGAILVDCTLGLGGHSEAVLREIPGVRVIGIDRDAQALALASERLATYGDRFQAVHAVYDELPQVLAQRGIGQVDGILADLGVSSLQIDEPDRGFAYAQDAPLDMRMDSGTDGTAADLLANASEAELRRILRVYGEESFASRIAHAIVEQRQSTPLTRTTQLAELVHDAIPAAARNKRHGHPAKRTFQALRIAVNDELAALERFLPAAINALAVSGRIVVESYHSLEDRLVKRQFAAGAKSTAPVGLPIELAEHRPFLKLLTKGAERATESELAHNPRSASVRLRAAERTRPHLVETREH